MVSGVGVVFEYVGLEASSFWSHKSGEVTKRALTAWGLRNLPVMMVNQVLAGQQENEGM